MLICQMSPALLTLNPNSKILLTLGRFMIQLNAKRL